jgi:ribosomal protein L30E
MSLKVNQNCIKNTVPQSRSKLLRIAQNCSKWLKNTVAYSCLKKAVAQSRSKSLKVAQSCLKNAVAQTISRQN